MRILIVLASLSAAFGQVHVDPVLARMVPPGTVSLAGARMDQIRATPLYQKLIAGSKLPDLDRFAQQTGFDPRHDVRELLIASNGTEGQSVVVARGTFGRITIPGSLRTFKHDIYAVHGDGNAGFCLLDDSTAAAGPLPGLYAALDHWHSGAAPATPGLLKRIEQMPAGAQFYAVSEGGFRIPGGVAIRQGSVDFAQIFRNVEQAAFSADLRAGLDAVLEADVKTEDDAKNLGDAARGLIGLARLSIPENHRELLKLWDGFHVDQHARHITLNAKVPQDLIDQLAGLFQSGEIGPSKPLHAPANPR